MIDHSELKRLAEAATEGQWKAVDYGSFSGKSSHWYVETNDGKNVAFDDSGDPAPNHWEARGEHDMKFIAAANPAAVLALIAEVEALRKDADRWRFFSVVANDLQAFPHSWGLMTKEKMDFMCDEAMGAARKGKEP